MQIRSAAPPEVHPDQAVQRERGMIDIDVPGFRHLVLEHLVIDYNGTLAVDGTLLPHVVDRLRELRARLLVHVVTADTYGTVANQRGLACFDLVVVPACEQAKAKVDFVRGLGAQSVMAIGNGRNDCQMLSAAALGIATVQREGAAVEALLFADVVVTDVGDALDLILKPRRLVATLRD